MFTQQDFDNYELHCKTKGYKKIRFFDNCYEVRKDLFITIDFSEDCYIVFTYYEDDVYNTNELMKCDNIATFEDYIDSINL